MKPVMRSLASNEMPYVVQCVDQNSGKTGTFLYDRVAYCNQNGLRALSPIFDNTMELCNWCHKNNIIPVFE